MLVVRGGARSDNHLSVSNIVTRITFRRCVETSESETSWWGWRWWWCWWWCWEGACDVTTATSINLCAPAFRIAPRWTSASTTATSINLCAPAFRIAPRWTSASTTATSINLCGAASIVATRWPRLTTATTQIYAWWRCWWSWCWTGRTIPGLSLRCSSVGAPATRLGCRA